MSGCSLTAEARNSRTAETVLREWREASPVLIKLWPADWAVTQWVGLTFGDAPHDGVLLKIDMPGVGLTSVPATLAEIKTLGYLNLRDNMLESVPESLGDFDWLTYLNLERNRLSIIPSGLGRLDRLKTLYLTGNPWQFKGALPREWSLNNDLRQVSGCDFRY